MTRRLLVREKNQQDPPPRDMGARRWMWYPERAVCNVSNAQHGPRYTPDEYPPVAVRVIIDDVALPKLHREASRLRSPEVIREKVADKKDFNGVVTGPVQSYGCGHATYLPDDLLEGKTDLLD